MARSSKQKVFASVAAYQKATLQLRAMLEDVDAGLDIFVDLIRADESVSALLFGTGASSSRRDFAQAMADFEVTRRRLRRDLLQFGAERGESIADMAKALGISRQLAYRQLSQEH
jgi:hypothetical protein